MKRSRKPFGPPALKVSFRRMRDRLPHRLHRSALERVHQGALPVAVEVVDVHQPVHDMEARGSRADRRPPPRGIHRDGILVDAVRLRHVGRRLLRIVEVGGRLIGRGGMSVSSILFHAALKGAQSPVRRPCIASSQSQ